MLWGIPTSLMLHVLVAALLVFGLPVPSQQPQDEQPVNVALVPAPDQPKPQPAPAPPPKPPEPKVEKPPAPTAEKPPPPEKQAQKPLPIEALKPVVQFGDKDTGPRKSLDGASAQDNSPEPAKDDASKLRVEPNPAENQPATPADSGQGAAPAPLGPDGEIELPKSAEKPTPKPTNAPKPSPSNASKSASGNGSGLPGARRLYSQGATGDALATTSMGGVPRSERASLLCASELQRQLVEGSYFPIQWPKVPLKAGNIIDAPDVAFSTTSTWYHLSFRCEVDTDATRVLSFDFRVGAELPRSEWPRPL